MARMAKPNKRDNAYWAARLAKDGRSELIARVQANEITIYQAIRLAEYVKAGPKSPAAKLSYHWKRANEQERMRFVGAHLLEINHFVRATAEQLKAAKAQKLSQ